jgi:hypothetical protein
MINIATSQPVHWPVSSSAVAVAPVTPVGAVSPAQHSQRDGQSGLGSERPAHGAHDGRAHKGPASEKTTEASQAAPILPRDKPRDGEEPAATQTPEESRRDAQDARAAEEERADKKLKLLDVLSTVWKASAAVVDNALGMSEELALASEPGAQAERTQPPSVPTSGQQAKDTVHALRGPDRSQTLAGMAHTPSAPPVAYTEQGASEWGPLELGRLVSKRA